MKDPEYLEEAKQRRLDVNPMSGAAIEKLIAELYATPPDVIAANSICNVTGREVIAIAAPSIPTTGCGVKMRSKC